LNNRHPAAAHKAVNPKKICCFFCAHFWQISKSSVLDIEAKKAAIFLDSGQNAASETPYCRERPSRRKSSCRKVRPFCSFVVCRE